MLISINYSCPEKHDNLQSELIEVFKLQKYNNRHVYHTKQAGVPIQITVPNEEANVTVITF